MIDEAGTFARAELSILPALKPSETATAATFFDVLSFSCVRLPEQAGHFSQVYPDCSHNTGRLMACNDMTDDASVVRHCSFLCFCCRSSLGSVETGKSEKLQIEPASEYFDSARSWDAFWCLKDPQRCTAMSHTDLRGNGHFCLACACLFPKSAAATII